MPSRSKTKNGYSVQVTDSELRSAPISRQSTQSVISMLSYIWKSCTGREQRLGRSRAADGTRYELESDHASTDEGLNFL